MAKQAADAATISADTAKLLERPWVTASIVARGPYSFSFRRNGRASFFFSLVLANIGHSAANEIRYEVEMFPVIVGGDEDVAVRERQRTISVKLAAGFSLFPGEVGPLPVIREADAEEISQCAFESDDESLVVMCLAGVVTYRFATSDSEHTTRFAYYVGGAEPDKSRTALRVGRSLDEGEIVFVKEYLASYAD